MSTEFNDFDELSGSGNSNRCHKCSWNQCDDQSGGGSDSGSDGDWNPGNDGNVFKNRSPKFKFVTIIKDNNISVNVGSSYVKTEQCCPEEEEEEHGKPCGGGRPRLSLTSDDSSAAVENEVADILEDVINQLDLVEDTTKSTTQRTTQPTAKIFKSDFFGNIMKMFEDSIAF